MTEQIHNLVSRLSGVKNPAQGRYIAKCPAHQDQSPSLAVSEVEGKVLIKCFSGCSTGDVLAAVGLEFKDLYPERIKPEIAKRYKFNPFDILQCLRDEVRIILLASADCLNSKPFSVDDLKRVQLAHDNIQDAIALVWRRS